MNKFINTLKTLDPTIRITLGLMFAVGVIVGQQTTSHETKKHYLVDASEVEVIYNDPYKSLTLDACGTEYECNIAQLLDDQANGRFISTDDPRFFPDSVPVIEPVDCGPNDIDCEKANKQNAGKPAH